jgi:hypothetical protein
MKRFLKIILVIVTAVFVAFWIGHNGHTNFAQAFDLTHANATPDSGLIIKIIPWSALPPASTGTS